MMSPLIVRPKNEKEALAIEAVLYAMEIPFEKSKASPYNPEWEKMMNQSVAEMEEGKTHEISIKELEDLWK